MNWIFNTKKGRNPKDLVVSNIFKSEHKITIKNSWYNRKKKSILIYTSYNYSNVLFLTEIKMAYIIILIISFSLL